MEYSLFLGCCSSTAGEVTSCMFTCYVILLIGVSVGSIAQPAPVHVPGKAENRQGAGALATHMAY